MVRRTDLIDHEPRVRRRRRVGAGEVGYSHGDDCALASLVERDPQLLPIIPAQVEQCAGERLNHCDVGLGAGYLERPGDDLLRGVRACISDSTRTTSPVGL